MCCKLYLTCQDIFVQGWPVRLTGKPAFAETATCRQVCLFPIAIESGAFFSQRDAFGILFRFLSCRLYLGTKAGEWASKRK